LRPIPLVLSIYIAIMKFLALSFVAAVFSAVVSGSPVTVPYAAIHGHELQPAPPKTPATALSPATLLNADDGNVPFSLTGPKFVSYIDNTVSIL
jgi:hypothetical protein